MMMLTVDESVKQLGVLQYGKTYNFTYLLTNDYERQVTIKKVIAGCHSCTTTSVDNKQLAPGEQTNLNVSFTPGALGANLKSLTVLFNTGSIQRPNLHLQFKSTVNA